MRRAALLALCACASTARGPQAIRVIDSPERAPDLIRKAGDGTLISRQLLVLPELVDPGLSRDGRYYSLARYHIGGGELYVGKLGEPARPVLQFEQLAWVGDHTIIYRRGDTWYRADPADGAFTRAVSTKLLRLEANSEIARQRTRLTVGPDGDRVILEVPDKDGKLSPWRYDVAAKRLTEILHNTRYDEILLDDDARPAFAIDRGDDGKVALFERTDRGWLLRTVDLPPATIDILDYRGGTLLLSNGDASKPRYVTWVPGTGVVTEVLSPRAKAVVWSPHHLRTLLVRTGATWEATDARYARLAEQLTLLGVEHVRALGDRTWAATAAVGDEHAHYAIDPVAGVIRELGVHRERTGARATTKPESIDVPSLTGAEPTPVRLYPAASPAHGIVFYGGEFFDVLYREKLFRLLTSRGYHVVTGTDDQRLGAPSASLATWATSAIGKLPMACVSVDFCDFERELRTSAGASITVPPGVPKEPAAIVEDPTRGWVGVIDESSTRVPQLDVGVHYPRAESLEDYDAYRAQLAESGEHRERDLAPVVGVTFRGESTLQLVSQFAIIEAFLAQHLGGRTEPLDFAELRRAGLRVTYGLDKLAVLAPHRDLALVPLDQTARAELAAAFDELLAAVRTTASTGCPGLLERVEKLHTPASLVRYRESDEVLILSEQFRRNAVAATEAAGCSGLKTREGVTIHGALESVLSLRDR